MSRKGKLPIALPKGVDVKVTDNEVAIKGPKGTLHQALVKGVNVQVDGTHLVVSLDEESPADEAFHGLYRTLLQNMVDGTTTGFSKKLEMVGVGYRASVQGQLLDLQIGFSHPTKIEI